MSGGSDSRSGAWQSMGLPSVQLTRSQAAIAAAVGVPLAYVTYRSLFGRRRQPAGATSFEAFLKTPPAAADAVAPTDFAAFLKSRNPAAAATAAAQQAQQASGPPLTPDSVVVTILFGTEYGFSKEIAEKLRDQLRKKKPYWPRVVDMADHPEGLDLSREQALLVVCSTQGDGVPPAEAREFCDWLGSSSLQAGALAGKHFSVCALGDRSYEHYCACGKMLDTQLEALGGSRFVPRTDVNREDWLAVNGWLAAVSSALDDLPLRPASETGHTADTGAENAAATLRWGKSKPYIGRVIAIEGLCNIQSTDDKDTVRVEIDLGDSGIAYTPGDALGICPSNRPQDVEHLLEAMDADGADLVAVPTWPYRQVGAEAAATTDRLPLRSVLTSCYDIRAPKPELLRKLAEAMPPPGKSNLPVALLNGHASGTHDSSSSLANGNTSANGYSAANGHISANGDGEPSCHSRAEEAPEGDDIYSSFCSSAERLQPDGATKQARRLQDILGGDVEAYLAPRHVADVLSDFPTARLQTSEVLAALRQLQPRLYSISSAQEENRQRVQVTVAVVRYEALGRDRVGVTSTLLSERLKVGDTLPVFVSKNPDFRLPADPATPIIMVGPGTGLAPFRSFMQHRLLTAAGAGGSSGASPLGPAMLFFGCRRPDQDYLYGDLLQGWADAGHLELYTAFSRQQAKKVYVQDRLREAGERVWKLLQQGGHFYVCGDAGGMATSVQQALLDIIAAHLDGGGVAAEQYLVRLSTEGRYQRDVWLV